MNPVLLSSLSLAVLIGVIALGFLKKWNVGILSFGAAMLMGMAAGMTQKQIVAGFNTSLFVILLGSMFLFSIAQLNGTMDLLAKRRLPWPAVEAGPCPSSCTCWGRWWPPWAPAPSPASASPPCSASPWPWR